MTVKLWNGEADGILPPAVTNLLHQLDSLAIEWQLWRHPPTPRVEDARVVHDALRHGIHTKNLCVKTSDEDTLYLLTCRADKRVSWQAVAKNLGTKRLSFADEARVLKCLHVPVGSVTPLAVMNDAHHRVQLLMDDQVRNGERVYVHPLVNDMTLALRGEDVWRFVCHYHHEPIVLKNDEWMR